ncbi:uncharacterized protein EI90DRAFT_3016987 [Cantharellus anzutake]|uniref:uncharacterized protein n=1 Tax=Cantharellus anzutake TaxID=1750568 RepID=UPI001908090B|nr:uncharacterized protein EI90DRAFT_3016987 [Cantharellus anzutake]KAF8330059.1 hypothetical protein EI90DRAFT_3016987 [Cantharellus anzutake]
MPPPLPDASGDVSNASILMLQANFSNSLTLLTTAPSVNDFLKATDGPFARLRSLVGQHTSTKDMPQFQPLAPLEDVVKNIVQEPRGHTSVKAVRGIGNILDEASVIDDLSFEEKGEVPQEVMKKFRSHNATDTGQTAWQTWLKLHRLDSQDAASLCKSEHLEIEEKYPDRADEAKAFYDKVLVHYGDIILSKDERETQPNESLHLLQKMTGQYAAQVCALSSTHPIGIAVVGFVADETVPRNKMVKAMGLPLTEDAALAIRNLYDGIKAFSPYQPDISKQSLDKYLTVKMEAMDENDIDYHTQILKRKDGLAMADKSYGPHSRRCTEAAAQLKTMIHTSYFDRALHIAYLISGVRGGNLYHSDPEQKLRIETMTEGKGMSVKFQRAQLMGYNSPEEYEKREVLHYAPDANGSVGKYMLPENEADLPDSPEGNTVGDGKIESPSPKRVRKKSKATRMHAPAKAKPPCMVPGNNSQVNEARLPQNKAVGPQGDDVVSGTPDNNSPVSSGSLSLILPSKIEPLNLLKLKATHMHALAKAKPPRMRPRNSSQVDGARLPQNEVTGAQEDEVVPETVSPSNSSPLSSGSLSLILPSKIEPLNLPTFSLEVRSRSQPECKLQLTDIPQNDVFMERTSKTVPESHTSMVIPPIRLIHPTPNSTPARGQSMSGSNNNGITYLTVNKGPTPRACSEMPSSTTSTSVVRSEALLKENVKCLVEIDIIKLHIDKKVPPPETLDTAQHWEIVRDVGDELRGKGANVGRLAGDIRRNVAWLKDSPTLR